MVTDEQMENLLDDFFKDKGKRKAFKKEMDKLLGSLGKFVDFCKKNEFKDQKGKEYLVTAILVTLQNIIVHELLDTDKSAGLPDYLASNIVGDKKDNNKMYG
jgi:hypothetical protein